MNNLVSLPIRLPALGAALLLFAPANLSAQSRAWQAGDSAWETGANWTNGGTVPSGSDQVTVGNGGTARISSVVSSVNRIYIGGATASHLVIGTGGHLSVTGTNLIRISQNNNTKGSITMDGGTLQGVDRALYLGVGDSTQAVLTLKNGGSVTAVGNVLMGTNDNVGVTATLNIGGESNTAAAAGWLGANNVIGGISAGAAHLNTVRFNHTSTRYAFNKSAVSSTAVLLTKKLGVELLSGVTLLSGSNDYTEGTKVSGNAVLLANSSVVSNLHSSTGTGAVTVDTDATLGGTGTVLGTTTISGTLKPGDYDYGAAVDSYGVLRFGGNVTLEETSHTVFTLNGAVRGVSYSAFDVAGTLSLGGTLEVLLGDDFLLNEGESTPFQLFTGVATGSFDSMLLPTLWNGFDLVWDTSNFATSGLLSVEAIPEPGAAVFLLLGAGALVLRRRK